VAQEPPRAPKEWYQDAILASLDVDFDGVESIDALALEQLKQSLRLNALSALLRRRGR
jgi:hypothetical protein